MDKTADFFRIFGPAFDAEGYEYFEDDFSARANALRADKGLAPAQVPMISTTTAEAMVDELVATDALQARERTT